MADESVKVLCRVRPLNDREVEQQHPTVLTTNAEYGTILMHKPEEKTFSYDHVCDEDSTQEQIFELVGKKITDACMDGYNGTIFAYGQTGSGKTHTVLGQSGPQKGIIPRVFDYLFEWIDQKHKQTYTCRCSVLEIYNEHIFDLLNPAVSGLQLRENLTKGVYVEGLTERIVSDAWEAQKCMELGISNRRVGETQMNRASSRSHCVLTLVIEAVESLDDGSSSTCGTSTSSSSSSSSRKPGMSRKRCASFNLVDLAGSERQKTTGAAGSRLKEAGSINKSLSALGNVIMSLVDFSKGRKSHVGYRDSKLTFLLKDSLGGNSKTYIIACVSPSEDSHAETLSTLKFASRAKMIKNKAKVNEDTEGGSLEQLKRELGRAREQLSRLSSVRVENSYNDDNGNNNARSAAAGGVGVGSASQREQALVQEKLALQRALDGVTEQLSVASEGFEGEIRRVREEKAEQEGRFRALEDAHERAEQRGRAREDAATVELIKAREHLERRAAEAETDRDDALEKLAAAGAEARAVEERARAGQAKAKKRLGEVERELGEARVAMDGRASECEERSQALSRLRLAMEQQRVEKQKEVNGLQTQCSSLQLQLQQWKDRQRQREEQEKAAAGTDRDGQLGERASAELTQLREQNRAKVELLQRQGKEMEELQHAHDKLAAELEEELAKANAREEEERATGDHAQKGQGQGAELKREEWLRVVREAQQQERKMFERAAEVEKALAHAQQKRKAAEDERDAMRAKEEERDRESNPRTKIALFAKMKQDNAAMKRKAEGFKEQVRVLHRALSEHGVSSFKVLADSKKALGMRHSDPDKENGASSCNGGGDSMSRYELKRIFETLQSLHARARESALPEASQESQQATATAATAASTAPPAAPLAPWRPCDGVQAPLPQTISATSDEGTQSCEAAISTAHIISLLHEVKADYSEKERQMMMLKGQLRLAKLQAPLSC